MKASREDKINKIRDIAFSLFLDMGYEATSMRNICKGAGIEQPTLYYFFGSKEGLFFSIFNRLWDQYKQFNAKHGGTMETMTPEQKLYSFFRSSVQFAMENRRPVSFYYRYSLFPPVGSEKRVRAFMDRIEKESRLKVEKLIGELIGQGSIQKSQKDAYRIYYTFLNNQMFNVTFSDYTSSETELGRNCGTCFSSAGCKIFTRMTY